MCYTTYSTRGPLAFKTRLPPSCSSRGPFFRRGGEGMATRRKLYIIGPIDWETYAAFSEALDTLEQESSRKDVEIELASDGGDAHAALAFSARISKSPCNINITGTGFVASAAVLILASGTNRKIANTTWVMVHEEVGQVDFANVVELEREAKQCRSLENQWNNLLACMTLASAEYWGKLHKETTHLTAKDCLDLGLVDEVI